MCFCHLLGSQQQSGWGWAKILCHWSFAVYYVCGSFSLRQEFFQLFVPFEATGRLASFPPTAYTEFAAIQIASLLGRSL
jgi:hypothetical protein